MAVSVDCSPPQPILLIHKGFWRSSRKPYFFLGKIWERNQFSLIHSGQHVPNNSPNFSAAARSSCVKASQKTDFRTRRDPIAARREDHRCGADDGVIGLRHSRILDLRPVDVLQGKA